MDVLVIGKDPEVLATVKEGLIARGIATDGTTDAERASIDFDARDFALVAFGGGVTSPLRERLKDDFRRQNPDVVLLDTLAPVAVSHISAALSRDAGKREFATRFEIIEDAGSYLMHLDLKKECDVCMEVYHANNGIRGITLGRGRLSAGPFAFRIHEREIHDGLNIILVTLDSTEIYLHKIERW